MNELAEYATLFARFLKLEDLEAAMLAKMLTLRGVCRRCDVTLSCFQSPVLTNVYLMIFARQLTVAFSLRNKPAGN